MNFNSIGSTLLGLGFVVIFIALLIYFTFQERLQTGIELREIPAFVKLRRSIGQAVEAGQRVHISLGWGNLNGLEAGSSFIGFAVLHRIAQTASVSDRPPIATSGNGVLSILSRDTLRTTYQQIGAAGLYDPIYSQLTGLTPFSFAAGTLPIILDQQVSTSYLAGHFSSEIAYIADATERSGGLTIAGSDDLPAQSVLIATAEAPLIGEELYASGAYLQAGPMHCASVRVEDYFRWAVAGSILIGTILKVIGVV